MQVQSCEGPQWGPEEAKAVIFLNLLPKEYSLTHRTS